MFRWDEKKMCPISKFLMSQETFGGFCVVCNYFIFTQNLRNLFSDIFFFPCGYNNLYFDIFFFPCGSNILYLNKGVLLVGTVERGSSMQKIRPLYNILLQVYLHRIEILALKRKHNVLWDGDVNLYSLTTTNTSN